MRSKEKKEIGRIIEKEFVGILEERELAKQAWEADRPARELRAKVQHLRVDEANYWENLEYWYADKLISFEREKRRRRRQEEREAAEEREIAALRAELKLVEEARYWIRLDDEYAEIIIDFEKSKLRRRRRAEEAERLEAQRQQEILEQQLWNEVEAKEEAATTREVRKIRQRAYSLVAEEQRKNNEKMSALSDSWARRSTDLKEQERISATAARKQHWQEIWSRVSEEYEARCDALEASLDLFITETETEAERQRDVFREEEYKRIESAYHAALEAKRAELQAEECRLAQEAEQRRLAREAEQRRLVQEAEQRRSAHEAEQRCLAQQAEQDQLAQQAEQRRIADEVEQPRLAEETEQQHIDYDADQARLVITLQESTQQEVQERKRKWAVEEDGQRHEQEEKRQRVSEYAGFVMQDLIVVN